MRELVEYIAGTLTGAPESVTVTEEQRGHRVVLRLQVDDAHKGKIIGRGGRVAESMRALLRVAAVKSHTRAVLQID